VVLSLQGGRMLDSAQVSAIVHLISSSVPQMSSKNVTVVDQNGTLLSAEHNGSTAEGLDANQLKYVQQIEHSYIKRIESLLAPMLGASNIRAQVSADIDFSRTEQTSEIFKPNQPPNESVIRSQQITETLNGSGLAASGVPGALSNQPPVPATAPIVATSPVVGVQPGNDLNVANLQKESTVNYEVDRTIRHTVLPVGAIKRLSVAVVVNGNRRVTDAKGKTTVQPLTDTDRDQINNLVREAMGFDQNRGDSLNVQVTAFSDSTEAIEELPIWQQPDVIELAKELFKYALITGIMLFVVFRFIKPAVDHLLSLSNTGGFTAAEPLAEPEATYTPSAPNFEHSLQTAKQLAQQEPKIVASVIKEWVNQ
jgi:flagellar M-ring protein FliF